MLLVGVALLNSVSPQISGPTALLGCLMPHPFCTVALVVSEVAPLIHEVACVTGFVPFLIRLVALIRG